MTVKSKKNLPNLQLFGRFLSLYDANSYSADDLKYFFLLNKQLVQEEVIEGRPYYKKDMNFEAKSYRASLVLQAIPTIFEDKLTEARITEETNNFKTLVKGQIEREFDETDEVDLDVELSSESVQEWFLALYSSIKMDIVTDLISENLIPSYVMTEFDDYTEDVTLEQFVMYNLITQNDTLKIFKRYDAEISEEFTTEFLDNQKFNPLETLLELPSLPNDSDRKYKVETIVSTLYHNNFIKPQ